MSKELCEICCGALRIRFNELCGPMPCEVLLREFGGTESTIIRHDEAPWSFELADGTRFTPRVVAPPRVFQRENAQYVEFDQLEWVSPSGVALPHFGGYARHEFHADGTAFCTAFFIGEQCDPPEVKNFKLVTHPQLNDFDDVRWAYVARRKTADGAVIQDMTPERFLSRERDLVCGGILPLASFNLFRQDGPSAYAEFFMEGGTTLSGRDGENASAVRWQQNNPAIEWNFQTVSTGNHRLPLVWRNQWGWVIRSAPVKRHLPPLTMYHYFDNYVHYPADEVIDAMADSGCQVLVMHENWRRDPANDGIPYDPAEFVRTVARAHRHGIRVAVYIRGNEPSVLETAAAWFTDYLQTNFDGLYMDYGGPFHEIRPPDEFFIDGRIGFRNHYMNLRRLRSRIGSDAVFYSHTGACYSALGADFLTGYVSGEGERGLLIRGRREHEYYSMAAVVTGTMWTAAFPEYSTARMVPFLAVSGQYPHNPIGTQCTSSSLSHPPEPGLNDLVFRPLWKLWSLFGKERDIAVFNDYNSRGVFRRDGRSGASLLVSADRRRALLIVANFSGERLMWRDAPAWGATGFSPDGKSCRRLTPQSDSPGEAERCPANELELTLEPYAVAGFYWSDDEEDFSDYLRPYHQIGAPGRRWQAEVVEQRRRRENSLPGINPTLRISLPVGFCTGYEESMVLDLFANDIELVCFAADGSFRTLKKLTRPDGQRLFLGDSSEKTELKRLLAPGTHRLGIYSSHGGIPFYSFIRAELTDGDVTAELEFRNELEKDRAFLTFTVNII